ncbi:MAG: S-methyl-5'-thioadenosine phosphorylase [Rhodobacteraceae bacterium]|nr:S-methyl-5'-thioadenosine phosphorylase [Paracoccaceae bacterium]
MSPPPQSPVIGIIGGSGLYEIEGLSDAQWIKIETPFGPPSDELLIGMLGGQKVVFLPRHGRGHIRGPSDLNFRANICALKMAGVTEVLSLSACGSFREELAPGTFVIVDQFIDKTYAREKTFFEPGMVAHVSMARPVCGRLGGHIEAAANKLNIPNKRGATYVVMEGPQFSSQAESHLYRAWNCDVIGMTNMPEAKLAREAEMCYATVAMVTDYDCWHPDHDAVTVEQVISMLMANADKARALVKEIVPMLANRTQACDRGCHTALDTALITAPNARSPDVLAKLHPIVKRVLNR